MWLLYGHTRNTGRPLPERKWDCLFLNTGAWSIALIFRCASGKIFATHLVEKKKLLTYEVGHNCINAVCAKEGAVSWLELVHWDVLEFNPTFQSLVSLNWSSNYCQYTVRTGTIPKDTYIAFIYSEWRAFLAFTFWFMVTLAVYKWLSISEGLEGKF